jgi:predicted MPP superfamily phosphohydrolase
MQGGKRGDGFRVETVRLTSRSLPARAAPLRFAQLSDIHLRRLRRRHDRLVEVIRDQAVDFVFLTGDLIGHRTARWEALIGLLGRLECRHGVFACRGNWEIRFGPRPATLREKLSGAGVELLLNESRSIQTDAGAIRVAGVDDLVQGWPDFDSALRDGASADYTILLSHAPLAGRFVTEESGVDLVLSGHTHGGQIRIPLLWHLFLPRGRGGFVAGLYEADWGQVYVNRGFGGVGIVPLRFRCPAEVTLIEVHPAPGRGGEGG